MVSGSDEPMDAWLATTSSRSIRPTPTPSMRRRHRRTVLQSGPRACQLAPPPVRRGSWPGVTGSPPTGHRDGTGRGVELLQGNGDRPTRAGGAAS